MSKTSSPGPEWLPVQPREPHFDCMEELEARMEGQGLPLPVDMQDDYCLWYLCTMRCSGAKCPVFHSG